MRLLGLSCLALVTALPAQVPSGFWTAWGGAPSAGVVCGTAASGQSLGSFPFASTQFQSTGPLVATIITPPFVAKHMTGLVLVSDMGSIAAYGPGGLALTTPLSFSFGTSALGIIRPLGLLAVRPNGNVVATTATFPPVATEYTIAGTLVRTYNLPYNLVTIPGPVPSQTSDFVPARLVSSPSGTVWVASGSGRYFGLEPNGNLVGPFEAAVGNVEKLECDPQGRLWFLGQGPQFGAYTLARFDAPGVLGVSTALTSVESFDVDGCGRPHILRRAGATGLEVQVRDPSTLGLLDTVPLATGAVAGVITLGLAAEIVMDTVNNYWVRQEGASDLYRPDGSLIASGWDCSAQAGARFRQIDAGDGTGLHLVSVIDRGGDADLDGFANGVELESGSDALDPLSTPTSLSLGAPLVVGGLVSVNGSWPQFGGMPYAVGLSGGTSGLSLGPGTCLRLALSADSVFDTWLLVAPLVSGAIGNLSATGAFTMSFALPPFPVGNLSVFAAAVVGDASGGPAQAVSLPLALTLP